MLKVPHKIIEVDLGELEVRFLAHYFKLHNCKDLTELEDKIKKVRRRVYVKTK